MKYREWIKGITFVSILWIMIISTQNINTKVNICRKLAIRNDYWHAVKRGFPIIQWTWITLHVVICLYEIGKIQSQCRIYIVSDVCWFTSCIYIINNKSYQNILLTYDFQFPLNWIYFEWTVIWICSKIESNTISITIRTFKTSQYYCACACEDSYCVYIITQNGRLLD